MTPEQVLILLGWLRSEQSFMTLEAQKESDRANYMQASAFRLAARAYFDCYQKVKEMSQDDS